MRRGVVRAALMVSVSGCAVAGPLLLISGDAPAAEWGQGSQVRAGVEARMPAPVVTSIDPPAPPGSTSPALAVEPPTTLNTEFEFVMTWLAPDKLGGRLMFARLTPSGWTVPTTIAENVSPGVGADQPTLVVLDTRAVRRTLVARTGDTIARSGDGGQLWGRLPGPALSLGALAGGDEGGYAFWLADAREGKSQLMGTRILAGETLLDARAAPGAATSAAMTWDGPVVAYRRLRPDGGADIAIVRRVDARWTEPAIVATDAWRATPPAAAGPWITADRRSVAMVWYTEASGNPRLLAAFSSDAGKSFAAPVEIDAGHADRAPVGPAAIALGDEAEAVVAWLTSVGPRSVALQLARVSAGGQQAEPVILATAASGSVTGSPQIARAGERIAAAWNEGVLRRVRAVTVPFASLPAPGTRRPRAAAVAPPGRGRVGDIAPDVVLATLDGQKTSLSRLRGRPVLLNLWATWCGPCVQEMPEFLALDARYRAKGVAAVAVNVDAAGSDAKVEAFVVRHQIRLVWLDPAMELARALRVQGLPATFVIDREGRIAWRRDAPIKADDVTLNNVLAGLSER